MKDEGFEYLLSILPPGPDKSCALHLLPHAEEKPIKYKRLAYKGLIEHDIFYNVTVREVDDEYSSAWDPSLFRTATEAMKYAKESYGGGFRNPVYIIEKVRVGNGWEIIGRDEIKGYEEKD